MDETKSHLNPMLKTGNEALIRLLPRNRFGDRLYSFINFAIRHKRLPKDVPVFNDVLHKIKTTDEILNPLRVFVSDKEFLKIYVKAIVGDRYNVPTIDIIRNPSDVDGYEFPADCCIKPTHASGQVIIRRDNAPVDKERIRHWFSMNHYDRGREANYKLLKPKVIIEPVVFGGVDVNDYKFFCFNGSAKLVQADCDRHASHRRMFFDAAWNQQEFTTLYSSSTKMIDKPDNFDEMRDVAERLSAAFGFVRVDLYSNGNVCLVGEITNCHGNAERKFIPPSGEAVASKIIFG